MVHSSSRFGGVGGPYPNYTRIRAAGCSRRSPWIVQMHGYQLFDEGTEVVVRCGGRVVRRAANGAVWPWGIENYKVEFVEFGVGRR